MRAVALVDESRCIGCTLCIEACPVDCIDMVPARGPWTEALRRAAGMRGRQRIKRIKGKAFVSKPENRKTILAAALARKRR